MNDVGRDDNVCGAPRRADPPKLGRQIQEQLAKAIPRAAHGDGEKKKTESGSTAALKAARTAEQRTGPVQIGTRETS